MEHDNEPFLASLSSVFILHRQRGCFSITPNHTTWDDYSKPAGNAPFKTSR